MMSMLLLRVSYRSSTSTKWPFCRLWRVVNSASTLSALINFLLTNLAATLRPVHLCLHLCTMENRPLSSRNRAFIQHHVKHYITLKPLIISGTHLPRASILLTVAHTETSWFHVSNLCTSIKFWSSLLSCLLFVLSCLIRPCYLHKRTSLVR